MEGKKCLLDMMPKVYYKKSIIETPIVLYLLAENFKTLKLQ